MRYRKLAHKSGFSQRLLRLTPPLRREPEPNIWERKALDAAADLFKEVAALDGAYRDRLDDRKDV